jgi:hypothetical protein
MDVLATPHVGSYNDRLAPQLRIISPLDRRIKRVRVYRNDFANSHTPIILAMG